MSEGQAKSAWGLPFSGCSSYFNFSLNLIQTLFSSLHISATNISFVPGYVPSHLLPLCQEFWATLQRTGKNSQMGRQKSYPGPHVLCPSPGWHMMELGPGVSIATEPQLFFLFNPRLKFFLSMTTPTVVDLSAFHVSCKGYLGSL